MLPEPRLPAGAVANGVQVTPLSVENAPPVPRPPRPTRATSIGSFSAKSMLSVLVKTGLVNMPPAGETVRSSCRKPPMSPRPLIRCAPAGRADQGDHRRLFQARRPHLPVGRLARVGVGHVLGGPDRRPGPVHARGRGGTGPAPAPPSTSPGAALCRRRSGRGSGTSRGRILGPRSSQVLPPSRLRNRVSPGFQRSIVVTITVCGCCGSRASPA